MALDIDQQRTIGITAGTLAHWLKDNRERVEEMIEKGVVDPDEYGMYTMATGFIRLYKECIDHGIITPPTVEGPSTRQ